MSKYFANVAFTLKTAISLINVFKLRSYIEHVDLLRKSIKNIFL